MTICFRSRKALEPFPHLVEFELYAVSTMYVFFAETCKPSIHFLKIIEDYLGKVISSGL